MKIRCSRCFKKYEDYHDDCPRCGKINDRDYSRTNTTRVKAKPKINFSLKGLATYECDFCGATSFATGNDCTYCGNSRIVEKSKNVKVDVGHFDAMIEEVYKQEGIADLSTIIKLKEEPDHPIHRWRDSDDFKFGNLIDPMMIQVIGYFLLFIIIMVIGQSDKTALFILFIVLGIPGVLMIRFLRNIIYSEEIHWSNQVGQKGLLIRWVKRVDNGRDKTTQYMVSVDELDYIGVEIKEATIVGLRFVAKSSSTINNKDFYIHTLEYNNQAGFRRMLVLLAVNSGLSLVMRHETNDNEITVIEDSVIMKYYVRKDIYLVEPNLDQQHAHNIWLKMFREKYKIETGLLDDQTEMMVFKMPSTDAVEEQLNQDPYIIHHIVESTIMEWHKEEPSSN